MSKFLLLGSENFCVQLKRQVKVDISVKVFSTTTTSNGVICQIFYFWGQNGRAVQEFLMIHYLWFWEKFAVSKFVVVKLQGNSEQVTQDSFFFFHFFSYKLENFGFLLEANFLTGDLLSSTFLTLNFPLALEILYNANSLTYKVLLLQRKMKSTLATDFLSPSK